MDQWLVAVIFANLLGICVCDSKAANNSVQADRKQFSSDIFANWTQKNFKTLLQPIESLNLQHEIVGQKCGVNEWEMKLERFLISSKNQYPLERNQDWNCLFSMIVDQNTTTETTRNNSRKWIENYLVSASKTFCFTGGPFTICKNSTCACDTNHYVELNHTCYGKIHANCGLGIGCIPGFQCIYKNCWTNSPSNCSSWELDDSDRVLGYCGGKDDIYFEFRRRKWPYKKFEYLMQGLVVSAVSFFGIVGNFLSVLVLTRPRLRSSMSHVLLGMTISDIVYLVGQFLDTGIDNSISYFTVSRDKYVYMGDDDGASYSYSLMRKWSYFMYELGNVGSIYFTILVSLERYIVICHSLQAKRLCTKKNALYASVAVCLFSFIFNFPKIFANEISSDFIRTNSTSGGRHRNSPLDRSIPNMTIPIPGIFDDPSRREEQYYIMTTSVGYSKLYNLYLQWGKIIFKYFIPYYWLIFFNFWIILELKRSDKIRQTLTQRESHERDENGLRRKQSNPSTSTSSTTRMMLCVVAVFGLCYLPLFIHEIFFRIPNYQPFGNNPDLMYKSIRSSVIYSFVKLFATLNSSVNFIIYCVLGEKFRMALKSLICSWKNQGKGEGQKVVYSQAPSRAESKGLSLKA